MVPPYGLSRLTFGAVLLAAVAVGFAGSWWVNRPAPPWLTFPEIHATYVEGSRTVKVFGRYTATKTCAPSDGEPYPLIWRQEVQGTGPEVIQYAPRPAPPSLRLGEHEFATEIPLTEGISPDGWSVAILATCEQEPFAIRSRATTVEFLKSPQ